MQTVAALATVACLVLAASARPIFLDFTQAHNDVCNVVTQTCNTLEDKIPMVTKDVPTGPSMETGLSPDSKYAFEHLIGNALRDTDAVHWATDQFARRMVKFLLGAGQLNGNSTDTTITAAFTGPAKWYSQHNTGYVGPNLTAIKRVLAIDGDVTGNIREVWGLMYVLTKTEYVTTLLSPLVEKGDYINIQKLGLNVEVVRERQALIDATSKITDYDFRSSNGAPNFGYPALNSWSRFDFSAQTVEGVIEWNGTRVYKTTGCTEYPDLTSDEIANPPLSYDELVYQCNGSTARPCKILWYPGMNCFDVAPVDFAPGIKGYADRAKSLGYRTVAGPSGTTANVLQFASVLGFTGEEMVLFRAAMLAWMLVTNDHSFYEIMLGADNHMPEGFNVVQGLTDLGQVFPSDVKTSDGKTFSPHDVWASVAKWFATPQGKMVWDQLGKTQQDYLNTLIGN
eukprot:m.84220 g.84220  ORF g.84220 m.84220 type:complete len:454 (+) comp25723_c0_seq1:183-1544(+)